MKKVEIILIILLLGLLGCSSHDDENITGHWSVLSPIDSSYSEMLIVSDSVWAISLLDGTVVKEWYTTYSFEGDTVFFNATSNFYGRISDSGNQLNVTYGIFKFEWRTIEQIEESKLLNADAFARRRDLAFEDF